MSREQYCSYCMGKDPTSKEIDKTFGYDDILAFNPFKLKKKSDKTSKAHRLTEKNSNCMWMYIQNSELNVAIMNVDNIIAKKKIKYCPMCGRKL